MNEKDFAKQIVRHLDRGLNDIKQGTRYQLRTARQAALDRYREAPQPVLGLALAGNTSARVGHSRYFNARYIAAATLLLLSLIGVTYWQFVQSNDISEIDVSLLTGDLPISAYLDNGFDAWLKRLPPQ
jgi:selenophosphate synthase